MALNQTIPNAQSPLVEPKTGVVSKAWFRFFASLPIAAAYPVGTIFTTTSVSTPETLLGFGTWTLFAAGPPAQWERTA